MFEKSSPEETVGEVLKCIFDEVNNPVSVIIGNARIIELESAGLSKDLSRQVKAIVDGAKRISLITHKLLKIDRLVSDNCPPDYKQTWLNIHKSTGEQL